MTPVGLILLVIMLVFLVFFRRHFVWFLSAMVPFPQTAMFLVAGQGISPFYAAASVASLLGVGAVIRSLVRNRGRFLAFRGPETVLLFLFAVWTTIVTLFGPRLFEGMGVISPRVSISAQLDRLTPLEFTISNFAQLAYVLIGTGLIVYLLSLRDLSPRILEAGIWVGLIFTLVNAVFLTAGIHFPRELFDTIPTIYYQSGGRLRGPFAEPSVLGAFTVAALAYLVTDAIRTTGLRRAIALVGIAIGLWAFVLSVSGTTLAAGLIVGSLGVLVLLIRWARNRLRGAQLLSFFALATALVVTAFWAQIYGFVSTLVEEKLVSDSLSDRSSADTRAYEIFAQTWGFGVGLGSNRPSGFLALLLSCVGLIGAGLFVALVVMVIVRVVLQRPLFASTAWALLGVFAAMSIAKADLPTPMLWMALAICIRACSQLWHERRLSPETRSRYSARHDRTRV